MVDGSKASGSMVDSSKANGSMVDGSLTDDSKANGVRFRGVPSVVKADYPL
jgi:hypothetical protein